MNVENGTFPPLVISMTGGEDPDISIFHKPFAQKIANKAEEKYEKVQTLIRSKLSFQIFGWDFLCIRGSHSVSKDSAVFDDVFLRCSATGLF